MACATRVLLLVACYVILPFLANAAPKPVTVLVGSSVKIHCLSPIVPPIWSWVGPKQSQHKTLAFSGIQRHPTLKDSRFSFSKNGSDYEMRLINVREADAGIINCQGDSLQTNLLNVLR